MEFLIEIEKTVYDITELITKASYTDKLNDGCSKLEFSYIDDGLNIKNGSFVMFKYNGVNIFYGIVAKHGESKKKEKTATAYDQLFYCKAKDTIVCKADTVTTLTDKACNYLGLIKGTINDTGYILPITIEQDKTWLDMIYGAIRDTLLGTGKWFVLRDEFGGVTIRDLEELKLDLVLGDESLAYDFSYEKSIEDKYYNQIKLAMDNETTGKRDTFIVKDNEAIETYGLLQYFEVLEKNGNAAQAKSKADMLLNLYNKEVEKLSLECLGDTSVRSGSSFYAQIKDIELNKRLIVKSVTHNFLPIHTMSLEVVM